MKNLYLAILLLAFATNLSAFDKVWELQFSSTPHHVHYTEGHKELIVGEGNTFKKYIAETGTLIDSVTMNFDSVLTKSIISYFITDDLKQIYALIPKKDTMYIKVIDLKTNTIDSTVFQISASYGDPLNTSLGLYSFDFPGQLVQISNRKFVFYANAGLAKALPLYSGQSGIVRFNLDSKNFSIYSRLSKLNYNNFRLSLYAAGSYSESWKIGQGSHNDNATPFQFLIKIEDTLNFKDYFNFKFNNYISCLSKNNNYVYSQTNDSYTINRTDFKNIERKDFWTKAKWLLPYRNDDEILICIDNKIFHYNFKVNKTLDEISINTENQFGSDLNNDYLLSIGSKKVTAFKSSFKASTVASKLKDTLLTKSTGDTITLNAISNHSPIKEEWDLGDGRTLTGDTVSFSYPKSGEYIVIYTATYFDTVVKHTCKIKILNKMIINLDYNVEIRDEYTVLTLFTNLGGDIDDVKTIVQQSVTNKKYLSNDSSYYKITYKLFESGIYNISTIIKNKNDELHKELKLIIPVRKAKNTTYEYNNLNYIYNLSSYNNKIYLLKCEMLLSGYTNIGSNYQPRLELTINYNTKLTQLNNYNIDNILNTNNQYSKYYCSYLSEWNDSVALKGIKFYSYNQQRLISNNSNYYLNPYSGILNIFNDSSCSPYKIPLNSDFLSKNNIYFRTFILESKINYLLSYYFDYNLNKYIYFSYSINTKDSIVSDTVNLTSNYYDDISVYSDTKNKLMISSVKDLKVFSIDNNFRIIDTLMTEKYNKVYSKSINGNHAFAIIDTSAKDTNQYLKVMDIKNKKSKLVKLDSTVKYHQVYQVNDSITCLMGRKDKDLVIETFKNSLMYFSVFKIEHTGMFTILEKTDDNELHLSFVDTSIPASNLIKTKGFASIFDSVSKSKDTTSHPDDSTSNPIDTTKKDTTKNKGIIYIKDNQFGSVIQDPEFKAAKIYFKDSLDLSNSFVKIYTEAGTEILTYSLSKDQKELPIQTDKLYHGIYYVRLSKDGEEYNLGKFIIFK